MMLKISNLGKLKVRFICVVSGRMSKHDILIFIENIVTDISQGITWKYCQ